MENNKCPMCKNEGDIVTYRTVDSMVKDYFRKHLKSAEYGFCTAPKCNVVYYSNEKNEIYFQRDLNVEVWLKEQANPIICYCRNVTMKDILDEIVVNKTSSGLQDIIKRTGAMNGHQCKTNNPSGKCCKDALEAAVDYALSLLNANNM